MRMVLRTLQDSSGRSQETLLIPVFEMSSMHPFVRDLAEGRAQELLNQFTCWQSLRTARGKHLTQEP